MAAWGIDEDTMIAFLVVCAALACAAFAIRRFRNGRHVAGVVWSIGAAVLGFVAWFFAAFQIRMF
jgi:lipopolysaccharide export LptBFGC system permease protein LptF